jgi:hypothetical protein
MVHALVESFYLGTEPTGECSRWRLFDKFHCFDGCPCAGFEGNLWEAGLIQEGLPAERCPALCVAQLRSALMPCLVQGNLKDCTGTLEHPNVSVPRRRG